jgi:hypothetical protein
VGDRGHAYGLSGELAGATGLQRRDGQRWAATTCDDWAVRLGDGHPPGRGGSPDLTGCMKMDVKIVLELTEAVQKFLVGSRDGFLPVLASQRSPTLVSPYNRF